MNVLLPLVGSLLPCACFQVAHYLLDVIINVVCPLFLGITTPVIHTVTATPVVSAVITVGADITMGVVGDITTPTTSITEARLEGGEST